MVSEAKLQHAKRVFQKLVDTMREDDWHFREVESDLKVISGFSGENVQAGFSYSVDPERELILFLSPLKLPPMNEKKQYELAMAVSATNMRLAHGGFDYSYKKDRLWFRITNSIRGALIGEDLLKYLLYVGCKTGDDYFEGLEQLANGSITLAEYLKMLRKEKKDED